MIKMLREARRNERGSIAVEFAMVMLFVLVPLLAGTLFYGRFVWHYTVAEKAAHDAARLVAAASPTELKTQCPTLYRDPCIVTAAMNLAYSEIAELNPGGSDLPQVRVYCDNGTCVTNRASSAPRVISVGIIMAVEDPFLSGISSLFTGGNGPVAIPINATARSYYVGY